MKKKQITVTEEDIAYGDRRSYCNCPVARAVKRAFKVGGSGRPVFVRHEGVFVGQPDDERFWMADLPKSVDRFITRFDEGKTVRPFTIAMSFR